MFCTNCGKEAMTDSKYCSSCGVPIKVTAPIVHKNNIHRSKITSKTIGIITLVIFLATTAIIAIILHLIQTKADLKYSWGTHYTVIEKKEILLQNFDTSSPDGWERILVCEDMDCETDGIRNFNNDNKVSYRFDRRGKLYTIYYSINRELTLTEKLDTLKQHYGNVYYVQYAEREDARYRHYYWLVDDTLVELYNDDLSYSDINNEYIARAYDDVIEYFNGK